MTKIQVWWVLQHITKPPYPITRLLPRKGIRGQAAQIFLLPPNYFVPRKICF